MIITMLQEFTLTGNKLLLENQTYDLVASELAQMTLGTHYIVGIASNATHPGEANDGMTEQTGQDILSEIQDDATTADILALENEVQDDATTGDIQALQAAIIAALTGKATEAKQDTQISILNTHATETTLQAIRTKLNDLATTLDIADVVSAISDVITALSGKATEAKQDAQIVQLGDILTALQAVKTQTQDVATATKQDIQTLRLVALEALLTQIKDRQFQQRQVISSQNLPIAVGSSSPLTVPSNANFAFITLEGGAGRFYTDGTTPTAFNGHWFNPDRTLELTGRTQLLGFNFFATHEAPRLTITYLTQTVI